MENYKQLVTTLFDQYRALHPVFQRFLFERQVSATGNRASGPITTISVTIRVRIKNIDHYIASFKKTAPGFMDEVQNELYNVILAKILSDGIEKMIFSREEIKALVEKEYQSTSITT